MAAGIYTLDSPSSGRITLRHRAGDSYSVAWLPSGRTFYLGALDAQSDVWMVTAR